MISCGMMGMTAVLVFVGVGGFSFETIEPIRVGRGQMKVAGRFRVCRARETSGDGHPPQLTSPLNECHQCAA